MSSKPPKGTSLGEDASFKPEMVKIRPGVQAWRESEKKSITRTGQDMTGQDRTGQ